MNVYNAFNTSLLKIADQQGMDESCGAEEQDTKVTLLKIFCKFL